MAAWHLPLWQAIHERSFFLAARFRRHRPGHFSSLAHGLPGLTAHYGKATANQINATTAT